MTVKLTVNNREFEGWKSVRIVRGLLQASAVFQLDVTDKWQGEIWQIQPYDKCVLSYNGQTLITGYVDSASVNSDSQAFDVSVSGRSKTADLVDCSVASKQFNRQRIEQIASALSAPFGVKVLAEVSTGNEISTWKPDEGSTVFDAIESLARLNGLLITDNANGDLVFTQAGALRAPADLVSGVNIKGASLGFDVRDRFSEYIVKGQQRASDTIDAATAAHVVSTVIDDSVTRHRPLTILAEDQIDIARARKRGQWEATVRMGRSQTLSVEVQGWLANGQFWQPNQLVNIKHDRLGLDTELLIVSVEYSLNDSSGTVSRLELMPPGALSPQPPEVEKIKGDSVGTPIIWKPLIRD